MALTTEEKILQRLEQILKVLALQVADDRTLTERVNLLKLADIDNKTIASIFELEESTVRVLISRSRKQKSSKRG